MIAGDENGDSFSMGKGREGSFVSMISDGMGTGQEAKKESRKIIEVMEELKIKRKVGRLCTKMT